MKCREKDFCAATPRLSETGLYQAALVGAYHQLGTIVRIELGHDARKVGFHRSGPTSRRSLLRRNHRKIAR